MSNLRKVDHITYAVASGNIEKWAWFHIEVEGAELIRRIDDARPGDPMSSMKIWCFDYGEFGIALIEGIDRNEKSQVTSFAEKHGDHSCQHIAYECFNLDNFIGHMKALGGRERGEILVQKDSFGVLKQIFAKGFASGHAGESTFSEYCQRPRTSDDAGDSKITFSNKASGDFYDQVQDAIREGDTEPFIDFSHMPDDWEVPPERPKELTKSDSKLASLL